MSRALLLILGTILEEQVTERANKLKERKMKNMGMKRSKRQRAVKSR